MRKATRDMIAAFRERYQDAINLELKFTRTTPNEWTTGDYQIIRWVVDDHGNRIRQYAATHRGVPLHTGVYVDLADAKRRCQGHAQHAAMQAIRRSESAD